MSYVDGFVLPVPTKNMDDYKKMATAAGKIWMKHGALKYVEAVADDVKKHEFGLPFPEAFNIKEDEIAVFSYIVYRDRAHRDEVNAKVMADEEMKQNAEKYNDVFDCKRMAYSGFKMIVEF